MDNEEDEPGVRCIGAPVLDENRTVVAAISVAGTTSQIGIDRVPILARQVTQVAREISSRLGYIVQDVDVA